MTSIKAPPRTKGRILDGNGLEICSSQMEANNLKNKQPFRQSSQQTLPLRL